MQEPEQIQNPHVRRYAGAYLRFQMLDARQGQHVWLRVGTDLVPDGLQPRNHVVQGDTLLRPVLVTRQQLGCQLRLLAWARTASDRAGDGSRMENPVPQRRHRLRSGTHQRRLRLRLEHEDVASTVRVPQVRHNVHRIDRLVEIDVQSTTFETVPRRIAPRDSSTACSQLPRSVIVRRPRDPIGLASLQSISAVNSARKASAR